VLFERVSVVVRGGGDLASGVIYRLAKAGFPVTVTELTHPLAIRRAVAYASAVYEATITVGGLTARRVERTADVTHVQAAGEIPVLVDDAGKALTALKPVVVVDARLAKRNLGTTIGDATLVIALGPGFEAGKDCHTVIETSRGHNLGRVIWSGSAEPDTATPGDIQGHAADRVLRAPADGYVTPRAAIGDRLEEGDAVAVVGDQPVVAPFDGVLRGLIHRSVAVTRGMKIGDIDPRAVREHCFTISDKSLAVGGGVLEAILSAPQVAEQLRSSVS
jgi:xanthine dehydrogenase accessory factor